MALAYIKELLGPAFDSQPTARIKVLKAEIEEKRDRYRRLIDLSPDNHGGPILQRMIDELAAQIDNDERLLRILRDTERKSQSKDA